MTTSDVVIIGAGPYGLSIAAHLKGRGVDFRIFGSTMQTWLKHMPKGMRLKSEGFASSLSDPGATFTLEEYSRQKGLPYDDIGTPVPLETFTSYGLEFQRKFVPEVENKIVVSIRRASSGGFQVRLADGETFIALRVVLAVGLTHYEYIPPELAALPSDLVSHSGNHDVLDGFRGREVAVVGAGSSAIDLAALLHQGGAKVQVIARKPEIRFHDPPETLTPSLFQRLRTPITGLGPGWKLWWCANAPLLFRRMPEKFRFEKVRTVLGPAPGWFIKQEVVGKVPLNLGVEITNAAVKNGRVSLSMTDKTGATKELVADHVICATGYRVDLRRLKFIDAEVASGIQAVENTPVLSSNFEASVEGLYFVGTSAANTFGPLLRFVYGTGFTAERLAKHLARSASRKLVKHEAASKVEAVEHEEVGSSR